MKLSFLLLASFFVFTNGAWAAACCGGGSSAPALILGDDRAQFSSALIFQEVSIDNVDSQGFWRRSSDHQKMKTLRIDGAFVFRDRWQSGVSIPFSQRTKGGQEYSGRGDIGINLGYEALTDWSYNPFRPKGLTYLQLLIPSDRTKAESIQGGLDSFGNGFWSLGAGILLSKSWSRWDASSNFEIHRSLPKNDVVPGVGGSLSLGLGYNLAKLRLGVQGQWNYEDPLLMEGSGTQASVERYATASFLLTYLQNDYWSASLIYSDQTLLGDPINTSLGQSATISFMRKWER